LHHRIRRARVRGMLMDLVMLSTVRRERATFILRENGLCRAGLLLQP
jgi:hypothetical protein